MKCNQQKKAHSQSSRGRILLKVKTKQNKQKIQKRLKKKRLNNSRYVKE
jgi:hypothetical protein